MEAQRRRGEAPQKEELRQRGAAPSRLLLSPAHGGHRAGGGVPDRVRDLAVAHRVQRPRARLSRFAGFDNYTEAFGSSEFWAR